jgi:predicted dehydrogenase
MNLSPEERAVGRDNFYAAIGSRAVRRRDNTPSRDFLLKQIRQGLASKKGLGSHYFGYESKVKEPLRVGVIGTGDEGSVLIGAVNPEFLEVKSIADIRPYNIYRAFQGEAGQSARPGLLKVCGWKSEDEARKKVKVYGPWQELLAHAKQDGLEGVIIALPLHLHAAATIAAMKAGLHVLTEKLMAHSVRECKEMARVARQTRLYLAVGHQRHYNILYDHAVELIRNGVIGEVHYVAAQWHRGNLPPPEKDSWKVPLPPGSKPGDAGEESMLQEELDELREKLAEAKLDKKAKKEDIDLLQAKIVLKQQQFADAVLIQTAGQLGYEEKQYRDAADKVVYHRPAIEELLRWRLWDRTGGGLMAELGSHQLDASSIFVAAMHEGKKQHPLSVGAAANRPIFPADRDIEDHVYCIFEFPAPGHDPKDPNNSRKKIGVQYASINGNGFGGYGETVYGTLGTLLLEREQEALLYKVTSSPTTDKTKIAAKPVKGKDGKEQPKPSLEADEKGDEASTAIGQMAMVEAKRGYTEELEHWAWCIRNPAPENQPRCPPTVAMADAVIALTANRAARDGIRVEFKPEWFDPDRDETPEGVKPDLGRYA